MEWSSTILKVIHNFIRCTNRYISYRNNTRVVTDVIPKPQIYFDFLLELNNLTLKLIWYQPKTTFISSNGFVTKVMELILENTMQLQIYHTIKNRALQHFADSIR